MAEKAEAEAAMWQALEAWADRNHSFVMATPSGKFYGLFLEPDGEGPRMQFMGSSLVRAYVFTRNKPTNKYT